MLVLLDSLPDIPPFLIELSDLEFGRRAIHGYVGNKSDNRLCESLAGKFLLESAYRFLGIPLQSVKFIRLNGCARQLH